MGADVEATPDGMVINGGKPLHYSRISTKKDHRIAMAFSLTGLRIPGVTILNPLCCRKTFENYFEVLDSLCVEE